MLLSVPLRAQVQSMFKQFFTHTHLDLAGFYASTACAVHCAFLPVMFTISALGGLAWLASPVIELSFILTSVVIAGFALGRNFRRHKHIRLAIQVVAAGFALLLTAHFMHGNWHNWLSAAGGFTIAGGHLLNWHLARKSPCCETH